MPQFTWSGSSTSSGSQGVPILSADEVGRQLNLDPKTIDWLKKEPANDDKSLLVLSYREGFINYGNFEVNKQTVTNALTNFGATLISDNVFKFDDWPTMYEARRQMMINSMWVFYTTNPILAQRCQLNQAQTITTTVISWFSEVTGKLTIQPYEFFEL